MSIMPEGGWGFQPPQDLQQKQDSSQRDQDAHQTHATKLSHMTTDHTTKAILVVIALLLLAIAAKVYLFPDMKAKNADEARSLNQPVPENGLNAVTAQPRDTCPTKPEAERAMNEELASMNLKFHAEFKVHDLQCRYIGGNTCDCQVLWDYDSDDSAFNESGKTGTLRFSKLGGRWRK